MILQSVKVIWVVIILLFNFSTAYSDQDSPVYQIPLIEGLTVDGSESDWGMQGFRVEILTAPDGHILPIDDFDVKFRLGWNQEGLFVLAIVRDDLPVESESLTRLWRCDCIEISVAEDLGHSNKYMLAVASGADTKYGEARSRIYDWRSEREKTRDILWETAGRTVEGGYFVETMLPWENLGLDPKMGTNFGFQLVANDDDGQGSTFRVAWFPTIAPGDSSRMYRLTLSDRQSDPVLLRIDRKIKTAHYAVAVLADGELVDNEIIFRSGDKILAQKRLAGDAERASANFRLSGQEYDSEWPRLSIDISGKEKMIFDEIPKLEFILERYIQAVGGYKAFQRLTSRLGKGRYVLNQQKAFPFEAWAKMPGRWTMSIYNSDIIERNGYDGTEGWIQDADRIRRADHLARSILGWWLNPQGPVELQKYFPELELKRKDTREGTTIYVVESNGEDGDKHLLEFDAETGLLSRIGKAWLLKNYQDVDGIRLPFQVSFDREGGMNFFELDAVEHNVPVDEQVFVMPKIQEVFADAFEGLDDPKVLPILKMEDLTYRHGEMNIPCRDGRFLYDIILQKGYKQGLEIGTYNGYSTLWLGLAFRETGGKIITIEIEPGPAHEARQNIIKAGLEDLIDSRINDAFDEIAKIEGEFDFIFIDANKEDYEKFFEILKDRIKPGGALVAHNVTNYARDMQDFLGNIQNNPDFETTFHPISVEGISVSIKRRHE